MQVRNLGFKEQPDYTAYRDMFRRVLDDEHKIYGMDEVRRD